MKSAMLPCRKCIIIADLFSGRVVVCLPKKVALHEPHFVQGAVLGIHGKDRHVANDFTNQSAESARNFRVCGAQRKKYRLSLSYVGNNGWSAMLLNILYLGIDFKKGTNCAIYS